MDATDIHKAVILEGQDATAMSRIEVNGSNVTKSDIAAVSGIVRKIFDRTSDTPDTAISTDTIVRDDTIFDDLQTDDRWDVDDTGYNFKDRIPGGKFPDGHVYRVEYQFTGSSSPAELFMVPFRLSAREIFSS